MIAKITMLLPFTFKHKEDPKVLITWLIMIFAYIVLTTIQDKYLDCKPIKKRDSHKEAVTEAILFTVFIIVIIILLIFMVYKNITIQRDIFASLISNLLK